MPEHRAATTQSLADDVTAELSNPPELTVKRGDWSFFYFVEDLSTAATMVRSDALGFSIRTGDYSPGLTLGWHNGWQLVGDALADDVTHMHWHEPRSSSTGRAIHWHISSDRTDEVKE